MKQNNNYQSPCADTVDVQAEGILCASAEIARFKLEEETWEW